MDKNEITSLSKKLSYALRHKPESIGIVLDKNGWTDVNILLEKTGSTIEDLEIVVAENNKQRFSLNPEKTQIRANQGHSVKVDLQLKRVYENLPEVLYHGTGPKNVNSILKEGLVKMKHHHVHLSADIETARNVGQRYSKHENPVIFEVDAWAMRTAGVDFYISENGVYLTDYVKPIYLKIISHHNEKEKS